MKLTKEQAANKARENGKLGGRPPKYQSAVDLESAINSYFDSHTDKSNAPKWHDMLYALSISDDTLLNYRTKDNYIKSGYSDVIKRAEERFCAFWQQCALDNPNLQSFCIFELKQPHNGGFADKQQVDTNSKQQIEVTLRTID